MRDSLAMGVSPSAWRLGPSQSRCVADDVRALLKPFGALSAVEMRKDRGRQVAEAHFTHTASAEAAAACATLSVPPRCKRSSFRRTTNTASASLTRARRRRVAQLGGMHIRCTRKPLGRKAPTRISCYCRADFHRAASSLSSRAVDARVVRVHGLTEAVPLGAWARRERERERREKERIRSQRDATTACMPQTCFRGSWEGGSAAFAAPPRWAPTALAPSSSVRAALRSSAPARPT
jgi:hypothetical protein